MRIQVLMFKQDDPVKCTAAKLVRLGKAISIKKTSKNSLILDPFSPTTLYPNDKRKIKSITGIDCSWEKIEHDFFIKFLGIHRRLPPLLAGNPVNYSKLGKLTTVEAIAGAAFLLGFDDTAFELLNKFKWGHTFYTLNEDLLKDYAKSDSEEEIHTIAREYGLVR